MVPTLAVTPATPRDSTRNYSNTPTSTFGSSSAVLGTLIARDLRSELKNERQGIRKMLPFEDRLGDNEINNAEAGEEARMISESDNIAVSSNAKHKYELAGVDAAESRSPPPTDVREGKMGEGQENSSMEIEAGVPMAATEEEEEEEEKKEKEVEEVEEEREVTEGFLFFEGDDGDPSAERDEESLPVIEPRQGFVTPMKQKNGPVLASTPSPFSEGSSGLPQLVSPELENKVGCPGDWLLESAESLLF